ncbi:MAG: ABC transporter ATP-binding protein, partial [Hydrogenophaga sp.]
CGMTNATQGTVIADGFDTVRDYRAARSIIGLVPQELHTDSFETVWATMSFSRGLFGKAPNPAYIETILKDLSLWDKKDSKILALSGGMKRRVLIAKALSHEPKILFLDEPSAGVDVELRHDMWRMVRALRAAGTTIILTTHYIEEAEDIAAQHGGDVALGDDLRFKIQPRREVQVAVRGPGVAVNAAVFAAAVGVEAEGEADVGRVVSGDGVAGVFERDLRGRRSGCFARDGRIVQRAPAIVERRPRIALEAVRLAVGDAAALDGVQGNEDFGMAGRWQETTGWTSSF